ncbi:MAG: hypothetical protein FWD82_00290 [Defluviitaleaceae bacterium]|nr:hypothetical protein [Defluviitaleaceae bacterium]
MATTVNNAFEEFMRDIVNLDADIVKAASNTYANTPPQRAKRHTQVFAKSRNQDKGAHRRCTKTGRKILKGNGFVWSPKAGAWQRQLNNNGRYAARRVLEILQREGK